MVEELDLPRPRLDADLVLRLQKYRNPDRVSPVVREAARRMASLAEALARSLQRAAEAALVILTIGPALELRTDDLVREEQFAEALLLDTAGRVAVDALVKDVR